MLPSLPSLNAYPLRHRPNKCSGKAAPASLESLRPSWLHDSHRVEVVLDVFELVWETLAD
jgi:hypothetical protein